MEANVFAWQLLGGRIAAAADADERDVAPVPDMSAWVLLGGRLLVPSAKATAVGYTDWGPLFVRQPTIAFLPYDLRPIPPAALLTAGGPLLKKKALIPPAKAARALAGNVVAVLFGSTNWECEDFSAKLSAVYYKLQQAKKPFEVVFACSDTTRAKFNDLVSRMPWYILPFNDMRITELGRRFGVTGVPWLTIIDANGDVIGRNMYRFVAADPQATQWPWRRQPLWQILSTVSNFRFRRRPDEPLHPNEVEFAVMPDFITRVLRLDVLGLYWNGKWADGAVPYHARVLALYERLRSVGKSVEFLFCSLDKSFEEFNEFRNQVPWPMLPFGCRQEALLHQLYEVHAVPALVLVAPATGDVICHSALDHMVLDPHGARFPWYPQLFTSLDATAPYLDRDPCFVLFLDGSRAAIRVLLPIADAYCRRFKRCGREDAPPLRFCIAEQGMELTVQTRGFLGLNHSPAPNFAIMDVRHQTKYLWAIPHKPNLDFDEQATEIVEAEQYEERLKAQYRKKEKEEQAKMEAAQELKVKPKKKGRAADETHKALARLRAQTVNTTSTVAAGGNNKAARAAVEERRAAEKAAKKKAEEDARWAARKAEIIEFLVANAKPPPRNKGGGIVPEPDVLFHFIEQFLTGRGEPWHINE